MKKTVLAILLACAIVAATQVSTLAQAAPQTPSESAPTIKDPAEYNAYVAAVQQKDPNAKLSALEAFLTQYPNSVMKVTALELLMSTYQQAGNQAKVVDSAKRLLAADPCNLRALVVLTFLARQGVASGQNPTENLADLGQYANKGLECSATAPKPAMLAEGDWETLKKQVGPIFEGGAGFAALQNKDYAAAQTHLKNAVEANPNDLQNVYPLCTAYLQATPADNVNGLYCLARSVSLAPANSPAQTQIQKYYLSVYKNYHGSNEGADQVLATAKASPNPPDGFTITKYVPPTPAQQAHNIVDGKTPAEIAQLTFGEWELVLSAGAPEDQDKVWSVIKGKPLQMEGNVTEVPSNTEVHIAASADDIEKKIADITLTMTGPIPAAKMPKVDDVFDFEGTPASYTSTPFMMMMEQGKLLRKPGETKKPPVHHHPVTRKK
jgi:tetratricopeptide (TPR) repeat protein